MVGVGAPDDPPLRMGLRTFFGLDTAKGENGQKRHPYINKFATCSMRSKSLSLFIYSVEALYYA